MSLRFFENSINSQMSQLPNDMYCSLNQAFIEQQWDNTTARQCIYEQDMDGEWFKDFTFHKIEAWLNYVVGETSTGAKEGRDFVQLIFKCLDHPLVRGRYYKFENCYWIGDFTDRHDGIVGDMTVRRCNNFMRIVDPYNGKLFSIPCVVNYDMSSPSTQVTTHIITPNNHATVMVQGNEDTLRLFKTNTRYILGGRPFKLTGYQNAIEYSLTKDTPNLLYLDLYLDEIHPNDNLVDQIADNGNYEYTINIIGSNMNLAQGSVGQLIADVLLNGEEVEREIEWSTSNKRVVSIDKDGNYNVVGNVGQEAVITAVFGESASAITISIVNETEVYPEIFVNPTFEKIAEFDTVEFTVGATYNGVEYTNLDYVDVSLDSEEYLSLVEDEGVYLLTAKRRTNEPQVLHISVSNTNPVFAGSVDVEIAITNMFG